MEKIIADQIKSCFTCYADCAENVIYFCGVPVMKIFKGFYDPNSKPSYVYTYPHGGSIPNMREMTKEQFFEEIERLKNFRGIPSDFPWTSPF